MRSRIGISITTTSLVLIATTVEVAIGVQVHLERKCLSTPAFSLILSSSEPVSQRRALSDTDVVRESSAGERVHSQLSSRIVLFEATNVSILCGTIGEKRTNLLCYGIAVESDDLLTHVGVTSIDSPSCVAIVARNVDLRSWHRAVKRSSLAFVGLKKRSLGEIDSVDCLKNTRNAVRRLRDGQGERHCRSCAVVCDAHLETASLTFKDISKGKRLARLVGHPARSINCLELDQGGWVASGTTNNIKQARTTIGVHLEVDSVIAGDIGIVVDIDSGDTVWVESGRNIGEGKVAN